MQQGSIESCWLHSFGYGGRDFLLTAFMVLKDLNYCHWVINGENLKRKGAKFEEIQRKSIG